MLILFIIAFFYRRTEDSNQMIVLGLETVGFVLMCIAGWMGGTLVYRNQIGVDHRYANAGKYRERRLSGWDQPVCHVSELSDGQMMLAIRDRERVVIGRCSDGIVAFSNHCTHRGGPLSDGALVGCTVQCPWHGSQFDVRTGRVIAGPAQHRIKTYDIDIRNGEVYVLERRPAAAEPTEDFRPESNSAEPAA